MNIVQTAARRTARHNRTPSHTFNLRQRPFAIQPFMIAPVLPGETLKNLLLQARVVSDPIKNKLIGWWQEYYIFYVKHRDLDARVLLQQMMLDAEANVSSLREAAPNAEWFAYPNSINWSKMCLKRVVEEYFRNEGEAWDNFKIGEMPVCRMNGEHFLHSAMLDDEMVVPDLNVDLNADATIMASELVKAQQQYMHLLANKLTDMTYEDYLAQYGVRLPEAENHRPELIRYIREWTYPTNTVEPTTGIPTSAVSWSIAERADKARYFREPGFIFGVTVSRPKVYIRRQEGSGVGMLDDAMTWLPALLKDDPFTSLKKFAETAGPLAVTVTDTDGYWIDTKDLFMHGDQMFNWDIDSGLLTATGENFVDFPNIGLTNGIYPQETTGIDNLFTDAAGGRKFVRSDGICSLTIASTLTDTSPLGSMGQLSG